MPEIDGLELQRRLAERKLRFPVVMITGRGEISIAVAAMKAGAVDFVEKPFTRETIIERIRLANDRLDTTLWETRESAAGRMAALSPRERQVVEGLVAGLPNKTIAYELGISPRTVEMHRARIMKKLDLRSLSALVRLALAAGIQGKS
jgi:two-component system response regulator FixJ